ncbi:hypothetical protein BMT_26215 [Priestia megaterium NBRC 15308 = ATCC 14581]|nr:hypothetical protein BMT_26215 [Priestia megaterium NBRC 15308 = ATCC 14581]
MKGDLNDESVEFFIGRGKVGLLNLVTSSRRLEGKAKTPAGKAEQMRPRRSASDEEAHLSPAESVVLHGNQRRCHKRAIHAISFVRLYIGMILLCLNLFYLKI